MPHFLLSLLPRKKKEWSIIILTGSIFLGTFYLGLVFGRARSIDYTQDGSTLKYLASRMKVDKFSQDDIQLIFDDGPKTYRYSLKADELAIEPKDPWKLKVERRWATLEYSRAAEITGLTAVEGGLLAVATRYHEAIGLAARYSPLAHRSAYITAALLAVGGGSYLGYYLSYQDKPAYGHPTFSKVVEDKSNWKKYASAIFNCRKFGRTEKALGDAGAKSGRSKDCEKYLEWYPIPEHTS